MEGLVIIFPPEAQIEPACWRQRKYISVTINPSKEGFCLLVSHSKVAERNWVGRNESRLHIPL